MNLSQPGNQPSTQLPTPPAATWSLVLGLLSIFCFGAVAGIPAIICGHSARNRIQRDPGSFSGAGMALAGLILGYISTGITVLVLLLLGLVLVAPQASPLAPYIYSLF